MIIKKFLCDITIEEFIKAYESSKSRRAATFRVPTVNRRVKIKPIHKMISSTDAFPICCPSCKCEMHHVKVYESSQHKTKTNRCSIRFVTEDETKHFTIDHIIPVAKGGTNDYRNLQIMCNVCNWEKLDYVDPNSVIEYHYRLVLVKNTIVPTIAKSLRAIYKQWHSEYMEARCTGEQKVPNPYIVDESGLEQYLQQLKADLKIEVDAQIFKSVPILQNYTEVNNVFESKYS